MADKDAGARLVCTAGARLVCTAPNYPNPISSKECSRKICGIGLVQLYKTKPKNLPSATFFQFMLNFIF